MKEPSAKVVHKDRKGVILGRILSSRGRWWRRSVVTDVVLFAISPTLGSDDDAIAVDGGNEDVTSDTVGSIVADDDEADEDANATDQRHGCKSKNVPMGLSSRERRA